MITHAVGFFRLSALRSAVVLFLGVIAAASAQTPPAEASATAKRPVTPVELSQADLLKAYLQMKEELHATQLAVANTRLEAEAAARTQTQALTEKIEAMKISFETERDRQRMEWQQAETERSWQRAEAEEFNRLVFWIGGVFGAVGLLAVLATPFLQWRALNRFVEVNAQRLQLAGPANHAAGLTLPAGSSPADQAVESSNQRLLSVIDRMERRILELEETTGPATGGAQAQLQQAPASLPNIAQASAVVGGGSAKTTAEKPARLAGGEQGNPIAVLLGKGMLLLELQKPREAMACYDEILRTEPTNAEALVRKGSALEQLHRDEEALECYDAAIRADRRKTLAYLYKGAVCNRLSRFEESVESYEQALKVEQTTSS
jgi:tetratricopeptide (TPR) repeat protein